MKLVSTPKPVFSLKKLPRLFECAVLAEGSKKTSVFENIAHVSVFKNIASFALIKFLT